MLTFLTILATLYFLVYSLGFAALVYAVSQNKKAKLARIPFLLYLVVISFLVTRIINFF